MRARRREINIFNMSLLDILCGALGAFCFMMLVALPYYKPSRGDAQLRENQEKTQELLRDIEKLKDKLGDPTAAADLEELLRRLQAQIQALEGQVNQLTAENQRLTEKNNELTAENDRQKRLLAQKKPFLVVMTALNQSQDVDLYLQDDMVPEGGGKGLNPPFDPSKPRHSSNWQNDRVAYVPTRGTTTWLSSDSVVNAHFKIYVKLANEVKARQSTQISGGLFGNIGENSMFVLPIISLTPERFWAFVGTLIVDADNKLVFKEATEAERDAEWKEISKSAPPPLPTVTPSASPMSEQDIRRLREELRRRLLPSPGPSPTAGNTAEERGKIIQKLRQEQSSPSPKP